MFAHTLLDLDLKLRNTGIWCFEMKFLWVSRHFLAWKRKLDERPPRLSWVLVRNWLNQQNLSEKTMNNILAVNLCIFLVMLVFNCGERPLWRITQEYRERFWHTKLWFCRYRCSKEHETARIFFSITWHYEANNLYLLHIYICTIDYKADAQSSCNTKRGGSGTDKILIYIIYI